MKLTKEIRIALVAVVGILVMYFGINFLKGINLFSTNNTYYMTFDDIQGLGASTPIYAEVVNFAGGAKNGLVAKAQIFDMYGKLIKEESQEVNVGEDQTLDAVSVSEPDEAVYYIKLTLQQNNQVVSDNFYVMGKEEDNLQALSKLPKATVAISGKRFVQQGEEWIGEVEIRNTGHVPALLIRLNLKGGDGEQILPVIYSDNYFSLMPNECKKIKVSYRNEDGRGQAPYVEVTGFNK
jgi:hypothetical protein